MEEMRSTSFREVYKNTWLKTALLKNKKDKLWMVFCIHDDTDPYLEAYIDNKVATAHKPHWYLPLNNTLHITPSIYPQDDEYEFVITLQTNVIRLSAPTWQLMIDWVETLRRKLHEMRILSPKENVYSKLPQVKNVNLLPTRDPTSPLPPPPVGPATIVPGVEPPSSTETAPSASGVVPPSTALVASNSVAPSTSSSTASFYEQLFLQSSASKIRAQRSMSNSERQPEAGPSLRRSNSLLEDTGSDRRLTLRAQQVLQLRKEIAHPSGVRLRLRRRDCINSIAFVDVCNCVWIAGWKQKEHPMLYNALHIGDQLINVEGIPIHKASDAHKILRNVGPGLHIELLVKRLPFGRVFAIRRDIEGQPLGLVQEDGTAILREILLDGLAARFGLPSKAQTMDGTSLTNWALTEINGRPLNLYFKDNEIRDRLNSVGRDISILVQPLDLIAQLKKQLKLIRNYKDYLLQ